MSKYYRRVEIDAEGNSAEPVNFVGVHPLRWNRSDRSISGNNPPDAGFVEAEAYEKEFINWMSEYTEPRACYNWARLNDDYATFTTMTLDELHDYWLTEINK
jgi:hypothetical protein